MKKIALAMSLSSVVAMTTALSAFEQSESFVIDLNHDPPGIFDFDTIVMTTAPPGIQFEAFLASAQDADRGILYTFDFDEVPLSFELSERWFNQEHFCERKCGAREALTVDTVLLVYTGASPPGHDLGSFASIMTDMETSATGFNNDSSAAGKRPEIAVLHSASPVGKEVQAEADTIVLASSNLVLILGHNAESDVLGYTSGYV